MIKIIDNILKTYESNSFYNELCLLIQPLEYHITSEKRNYMNYFVNTFINMNNNPFFNKLYTSYNKNKNIFIEIYIKILKTFNSMRKLLFLYKKSKYETIIKKDLLLNSLDENSKNVICIIQNKKKYLFYIFELSKIIYISLSNSLYFFSEPLEIKNPYNNLTFEYHNMCNIYFFMKFNCYHFNELFCKYFKSNFVNKLFLHNNFNLLRHYSIINYVNNKENNYLYIEIMNMINNYNNGINIEYRIMIHEEFPMELLYKIMKKYILLYIYSWYSYLEYENNYFAKELNHRLYYFQQFNPKFGRMFYKIKNNYCFTTNQNIIQREKMFNYEHIHFMSDLNMRFDGHYKYLKLRNFLS